MVVTMIIHVLVCQTRSMLDESAVLQGLSNKESTFVDVEEPDSLK